MSEAPPLAGVVGWPIGHSLSPRLHGHWLKRYGIAGYYVPIALSPEAFEAGLLSLPRLGFRGVNVTIPHKEAALALASAATDRARGIGAANTLTFGPTAHPRRQHRRLRLHREPPRMRRPAGMRPRGRRLSSAPAARRGRSIAALLAEGAPGDPHRQPQPASAPRGFRPISARAQRRALGGASASAAAAATIVNTTPVGMGSDAVPIDLAGAGRGALVADVVYGSTPTPFVAGARALGDCRPLVRGDRALDTGRHHLGAGRMGDVVGRDARADDVVVALVVRLLEAPDQLDVASDIAHASSSRSMPSNLRPCGAFVQRR